MDSRWLAAPAVPLVALGAILAWRDRIEAWNMARQQSGHYIGADPACVNSFEGCPDASFAWQFPLAAVGVVLVAYLFILQQHWLRLLDV